MMLESGRARVGKKVTSTPAPSPSLLQRIFIRLCSFLHTVEPRYGDVLYGTGDKVRDRVATLLLEFRCGGIRSLNSLAAVYVHYFLFFSFCCQCQQCCYLDSLAGMYIVRIAIVYRGYILEYPWVLYIF